MVVASLIDSLSKIGAIGGIVSFVGVGLLILLLAAQSRQMRAMREWIDAEPERQAEASQRVIAEVQRRIAAARERRQAEATGAPVPPSPPAPRNVPPAPGTLGATPEARKVAAEAKGAETVISPAAGSVPPPVATDADGAPKFAPLTPAGDAAGTPEAPAADELAPIPSLEPGQDTQPADALPDDYDPLAAATPAARASDPRFHDDHFSLDDYEDEEPQGSRLLFGAGAAALVVGILIAAFVLLGGGDDAERPQASTPSEQREGGDGGATRTPTAPATIDPASVRVMVLNGTTVNGLAQSVTDQLTGKGYTVAQPNTLGGQSSRASTSVEYRAGKSAKARQVAKDLGLASSSVQEIEADVVSPAAPETAEVVVVAGQDLSASTTGAAG